VYTRSELLKFGLLAFSGNERNLLAQAKLSSGRISLLAARNGETVLTIAMAKNGSQTHRPAKG
jgi:hypothetical protein